MLGHEIMNRIAIREHILEDLDAYAEWQSDPDVARHLVWLPKNRAEAREELLDAIAQQTAVPRSKYFFAIVWADTAEVIGDVGFTITATGTGDCGWFLRRKYWGHGYATEATKLIIQYAFGSVGLDRLSASCSLANPASEKVMLNCGFKCKERSESRVKYEIKGSDMNH